MIVVNRRYRFSASHRLHVEEFDDARNEELFGKCNNPFGHGHNYELEVSAAGEVDGLSGRGVDPGLLDELVNRTVVARYDHRYLNEELPEFAVLVPTTENLGAEIWRRLEREWDGVFARPGPSLVRIRIYETERNIFEVARPDVEGRGKQHGDQ